MDTIDPALKEFTTPHRCVQIDAINEAGSVDVGCEKLGINSRTFRRWLCEIKVRAARLGHAPGHFDSGVAPGYRMGKVTIQRTPDGVERVWERQHPDAEQQEAVFQAAIQGLRDDLPRAEPIAAPAVANGDLLTVYPQGDPHAGLYAWSEEVGEGFDLVEFERINVAAIDQLVASAPAAAEALLIDLGDSLHADDNRNRTPTSQHPLDVHGRQEQAVRVAMKLKRHQIARMLEKHQRVTLRINPGNHDPRSARALSIMLEALYEREPRIEVVTSPNRYWYRGFGANLIGTTHGDGAKGKDLPLLMATDVPQLWAASERGCRTWFVGHVHHKDIKDYPGVTVEYTRTLAAQDAWSHGVGYRSKRTMEAVTFHRTDGEIARSTVGMAQINRASAA